MKPKMFMLALFLCLISALSGGIAADASALTRILVMETTDIHGAIMDISSGNEDTYQYRLAYIADAVSRARASGAYDDVILLDGGDIYQGTPLSYLTGGAPLRAAMDEMDYDAVCLGNHEFDWDVTEYCADLQGTLAPYVIGDDYGDPDIPVLAANLYDAQTGSRVPFTKDYVILEKAGKRIAVIGYIPQYQSIVIAEKIDPYSIDDSPEHFASRIRQISEAENPDALIVLAHTQPVPLANALDPALVDLVAGGHTHRFTAETAQTGIACIQAGCQANGFACAELVFEETGALHVGNVSFTDITADRTLLYDTAENASHLNEKIMNISRSCHDVIKEQMSEVLGWIDTPVIRENTLGANSAGNWVTGLMLRYARPYGAVAAFYNTSGIRTNLKIPKNKTTRNVTVNDVYTIMPFGNSLLIYELTGKELAEQLVKGLGHVIYGDQMSGLTFTYSASGDDNTDRKDREYTIWDITLDDGTHVDPHDDTTLYRVCTSSYNATLKGSVFADKEPLFSKAEAPVDYECLTELLREEGRQNNGYLFVDDGPRGVEISPSVSNHTASSW